jgi:hypothetical protein
MKTGGAKNQEGLRKKWFYLYFFNKNRKYANNFF